MLTKPTLHHQQCILARLVILTCPVLIISWYRVSIHTQLVVWLYWTIPNAPNIMDIFPYVSILRWVHRERMSTIAMIINVSEKIAWHKVINFTDSQITYEWKVIGKYCHRWNVMLKMQLCELWEHYTPVWDRLTLQYVNWYLYHRHRRHKFPGWSKEVQPWKTWQLFCGNMEREWETTRWHSIRHIQTLSSWISLCHQIYKKR